MYHSNRETIHTSGGWPEEKGESMGKEKPWNEIYAVDFDGTLNIADKYPQLGEPNRKLFQFLIKRQQEGDKIILWTCREGDYLKSAVKFCMKYGLKFDAINNNLPENIEKFNNNCRKVFADYYIDDKNRFLVKKKRKRILNILRKYKKD